MDVTHFVTFVFGFVAGILALITISALLLAIKIDKVVEKSYPYCGE
jgi:MFS superfamily sulfate permease-like transporter